MSDGYTNLILVLSGLDRSREARAAAEAARFYDVKSDVRTVAMLAATNPELAREVGEQLRRMTPPTPPPPVSFAKIVKAFFVTLYVIVCAALLVAYFLSPPYIRH
jgi:hypothetical protein